MPPFKRTLRGAPPLIACALLAGCLVGPDYRRPPAPLAAAYKEASPATPAPAATAAGAGWWTAFGDPVLDDLEARIAASNQTVAAAEAAYRQATALVREQKAALFPTLTLNGSVDASRGGAVSNGGTGVARTATTYQVGAGASWAPDVWGGVRRSIESARAGARASAADLAGARLAAQIALASDFIQLRQLDEQKRLLDATAAAYRRSLTITQNRYQAGVAAKSDVLSAQTQLANAEAQTIDLSRQRATFEHAIAILTGAPPATLTLPPGPWTFVLPTVPAGLPSTLLQRRPDIAAAERRAAAANAFVGVQTAALFPSFALTGQGGLASTALGRFFNAPNTFWTVGGSVAQTVFDAGAKRARVAEARAAYDQTVAVYRQTVLTGLGQVEDNLAAQQILAPEAEARRAAALAANANEDILKNQYLAGQTDYTAVVVAQATALSARNAEVQVQAMRLTTAVDLIGALGGGWSSTDPVERGGARPGQ